MADSPLNARRRLRRLIAWSSLAAAGLSGGVLGEWIWTSGNTTYLDLQAASDPIHRAALIALPVALGLLALVWMLSELGRLRAWLRWGGRTLAAMALVSLTGLPVFVWRFDQRIEARGLEGQFEAGAGGTALPPAAGPRPTDGPIEGLYREVSAEVPNLAIEGLGGGELLTLDRHTLARKRPDGSFAWHAPRPGPPPASLLLEADRIYYTGLGGQYEDDLVVAAYDRTSGRRLWRLHCLGNALSPAVVDGDRLALATWRPAGSSLHLIDLAAPAQRWAVRLSGEIRLAPRFGPAGLEVAVDGDLLRLSEQTGQLLARTSACDPQPRPEVACRDGRVVAWQRGVP